MDFTGFVNTDRSDSSWLKQKEMAEEKTHVYSIFTSGSLAEKVLLLSVAEKC